MKLDRVQIKNFRSIADLSLELQPSCRILVGVNESGKSNVLAALALLNPEREIRSEDIREPAPDEPAVDQSFVYFIFSLDQDDRGKSAAHANLTVLPSDVPFVTRAGKTLTAGQFAALIGEVLQVVNLTTKKRYASTWSVSGYRVLDGWMKLAAGSKGGFALVDGKGDERDIDELTFVHKSMIPDALIDQFTKVEASDLPRLGLAARDALTKNLPPCIYWSYSDANLLPSQINKVEFLTDPNTCRPLSQMFELAGFEDPAAAFATAELRSSQAVRNLLEKVAARTTEHIKSVWSECGDIQISLRENGQFIDATIKDELNHYAFDSRSDGFKRFVSFLLLISAREKTDGFTDGLYLQDEPDLGLHPSGVRFLREELIRISRTNAVVVSTHSIFMIDRERIDRHAIIVKEKERTEIRKIDSSNMLEEEVIYNALGYSVFDQLKPNNLIFEGWRDKKLFECFSVGAGGRLKRLASQRKVTGLCHARGVRDVARVVSMLDLAGRKHHVITDGDAPALEQQRRYATDHHGSTWSRYDELTEHRPATTAEDFLIPAILRSTFRKTLAERTAITVAGDCFGNGDAAMPTAAAVLNDGGIGKEEAKKVLEIWKSELFDNLQFDHIRKEYLPVAQAILDVGF